MKKPRIIPIIVVAVVSVLVLFGGWTIYNQVAIAAPLQQAFKNMEGVVSSTKPVITRDQVTIEVVLAPGANIREIYESISANGKDVFGDRRLKLDIKTEPNKQLDDLWYASLFKVAEAMENKAYSEIPKAMSDAAKSYEDVTVSSEMDNKNVYITIKNKDAVKYVVLPRTPGQMEVW